MKKVFLSLATIAFVAAGSLTVISCGGDDSNPTPGPGPEPEPELTENFIQVNSDQEAIDYTIYAVHVLGEGDNAPIREYALEDGRKVAIFEFISHNGTSAGAIASSTALTDVLVGTLVDETIPVGTAGRYSLPYVKEGGTLILGLSTSMNDTDYTYSDAAELNVSALDYTAKTMTYVLSGVDADDSSISIKTNLNGTIEGLYSLPTTAAKSAVKVSKKDINLSKAVRTLN